MSAHPTRRSNPSSTVFSAELRPELRSRRRVVVAAALLYLAGGLLIAQVDLGPGVRVFLVLVCLLCGAVDCLSFARAQAGIALLRVFPGGRLRVERSGRWCDAELCAGSVVLRRWAWLRLREAGGRRIRCLLLASGQTADDWRRFLVISRHLGGES